jgi:hypothetical protein
VDDGVPGPLAAQVAGWVREEMALGDDAGVTVRQRPGTDPRCSPVVTEVEVVAPGEPAVRFHIEREPAEVERMDVVAALAFGGGH